MVRQNSNEMRDNRKKRRSWKKSCTSSRCDRRTTFWGALSLTPLYDYGKWHGHNDVNEKKNMHHLLSLVFFLFNSIFNNKQLVQPLRRFSASLFTSGIVCAAQMQSWLCLSLHVDVMMTYLFVCVFFFFTFPSVLVSSNMTSHFSWLLLPPLAPNVRHNRIRENGSLSLFRHFFPPFLRYRLNRVYRYHWWSYPFLRIERDAPWVNIRIDVDRRVCYWRFILLCTSPSSFENI